MERFAAACAALYLAVQTLQFALTRTLLADAPTGLAALLARQQGAEAVRGLSLLLSHVLLIPMYAEVALRRFARAPAAAISGVAFGTLFVACELAYRSIDYFLAGGAWAAEARAAADPAPVLARVAAWEQVIAAWYFPLLTVHLAATTAFTVACWPRAGDARRDWLGAAAFGLNGVRLAGRILGGYAGVAPLAALSGPLYFPTVAAYYALLVVWLSRRRAPA